MKNAESRNLILVDLIRFRRTLSPDSQSVIKRFQKKNIWLSLVSITLDWVLIVSALFLLSEVSLLFAPLAILVIGARQRALSNLIHDASHGNLSANRKANDFLANAFAAFPMMESVQSYRESHVEHHLHLGKPGADPDFEIHRRYGFDDLNPPRNSATKTYFKLLFNAQAWKDSIVGSVRSLNFKELTAVTSWWIAVTVGLSFFGNQIGIYFLMIWILARGTSFHAVRIFAEFLDHSGLEPKSVLSYTRNIPGAFRPLCEIFHPHSDNFHLVHHLLPQNPHYKLKEAHELLLQDSGYQIAHHCDGYFVGRYPAIKSWSRGGEASWYSFS